ncbi:MAG: hypothetical protein KBS41_03675 [Oscillospiraceae bacterium]|nr:hypothetical protein [Candidatus Equicaccousia limihippi]
MLVNKQMIKTGIKDIPDVYREAINKKEEISKFLADLQKIHEEYAQSAIGISSANIIPTTPQESQQKFSNGYVTNPSTAKAVMTEDRINSLIEDSGAGARTDYAQSWITAINPTDFLNMTLGEKNQNR